MAFYMGLAYFWTQLYLTYQTQPSHDRRWVGPVRASCCTFCTILVITSILSNQFTLEDDNSDKMTTVKSV